MRFDGSSGARPSTEARRYVLRMLATFLQRQIDDGGHELIAGLDDEFDRRRVRTAARLVAKSLDIRASRKTR